MYKRLWERSGDYTRYTDYTDVTSLKKLDFIMKCLWKCAEERKSVLRVLDLGCGSGSVSFPAGSCGFDVTALDVNSSLIASCRKRNKFSNINFVLCDAESLDLSAKFDAIICSEVLEHVSKPESLVAVIDEHLDEGGVLILTIPNGYSLLELLVSRLLSKGGKSLRTFEALSRPFYRFVTGASDSCPFSSPTPHVQFFSTWKINRLLAKHGFVIEEIRNSNLGLFIPGAGRTRWLKSTECKVADILPHRLAGGWFLRITKGPGTSL